MYLLFAYDQHYPEGASKDFVCKYNTFKECLEQIIDVNTLEPKSSFIYNEIYDVALDDWYVFQTVNEVKDGVEMLVEMLFRDPENEEFVVTKELLADLVEIECLYTGD